MAFLTKSLADENRLRIMLLVSDGKKSVSQIVESLQLSQPLVSHHLRELKRSLLVKVERSGPFVFYELAHPKTMAVLAALKELTIELLNARTNFS